MRLGDRVIRNIVGVVIMATITTTLGARPTLAECPHVARLNGDPQTVEAVATHLETLDITTETISGCPSFDATVEAHRGKITLAIGSAAGAKLAAGGRLGPLCLGVQIRFGFDTKHIGPSAEVDANRVLLEGALFAHFIISVKRLLILPGVSIGGGSYNAKHHTSTASEEQLIAQNAGARFEVFASLAFRVTRNFAIDFLYISGTFSAPHYTDFVDNDSDPNTKAVKLREPEAYLRDGIGIRYNLRFGN
jgi:hypothetical protein